MEAPRDRIAQALAMLVEGIEQLVRDANAAAPRVDRDEVMTSAKAAKEGGFSVATISRWCQEGRIAPAQRKGERGHWRFKRSAWEKFRSVDRRSPRLRGPKSQHVEHGVVA